VSTTFYNHYSWLATMEDLFDVSSCVGTSTDVTLPAGTVCGGLDGQGHIGYAAQVGLTAFGSDVFTAPTGNGFMPPIPSNPERVSLKRRWPLRCRPLLFSPWPGTWSAVAGRPLPPDDVNGDCADSGYSEGPGPATRSFGRSSVLFFSVVIVLALTMAWGIHGLVSKPGLNTADPQSWLPKQQLDHPVDQTVVGTVANPGLTVDGGYVQVKTPTFSALAVVNGPVVPGEGLPSFSDLPPVPGRSRSAT